MERPTTAHKRPARTVLRRRPGDGAGRQLRRLDIRRLDTGTDRRHGTRGSGPAIREGHRVETGSLLGPPQDAAETPRPLLYPG